MIEPRPLGTAGAIRFARNELRSDPVLVNTATFDNEGSKIVLYQPDGL